MYRRLLDTLMRTSTSYNDYLYNAYLFKKLKSNPNMKLCGIASYDANAYKFLDLLEEYRYGQKIKKEKVRELITYDRAS